MQGFSSRWAPRSWSLLLSALPSWRCSKAARLASPPSRCLHWQGTKSARTIVTRAARTASQRQTARAPPPRAQRPSSCRFSWRPPCWSRSPTARTTSATASGAFW
eukprot:Amastigsp_a676366_8.p5 type:complete len:105 gc:universal Amastigsp_a676366_8:534-848(+)